METLQPYPTIYWSGSVLTFFCLRKQPEEGLSDQCSSGAAGQGRDRAQHLPSYTAFLPLPSSEPAPDKDFS